MFMKTTAAAALLGAALMTTAAVAQTTTPSGMSKTPSAGASSTEMQSHEGLWRASKLVGVNVYNDNNEKLGDISDLLVDKGGNIKNVIIGVGGFLGVGERYISVSFDQLKFSDEPMRTAATTSTQPPAGAGTPAAPSSSRTVGASGTSSSTSSSSGKNWYPDHAILSMSKDQMKSLPQFKY